MYIHIYMYIYTYVWRSLSNWPSDSQISGPQCSNFLTVLERYGLEIALVQVQGICSLFLDICTDLAGALIFLSGSDSTIFTVSDSSISETVSFQVHSWRFWYVGRFKFIEFWASKFMELGSYGSYMLQCLRFGVYMLLCLKVHRFWGIYKYNIMFKHFFPPCWTYLGSKLNYWGFKFQVDILIWSRKAYHWRVRFAWKYEYSNVSMVDFQNYVQEKHAARRGFVACAPISFIFSSSKVSL